MGIVFGIFFYEKQELVFDFNRNFGFVDYLVHHLDDELMGFGTYRIYIDADGFDKVFRVYNYSVFGFAGLYDELNFV